MLMNLEVKINWHIIDMEENIVEALFRITLEKEIYFMTVFCSLKR